MSQETAFKNIGKIDLFINCCSDPTVENSKKYISQVIKSNFLSTLNMLNHAIKSRSKIIYFSTSRVYSINKINELIRNKNFKKKISIIKKISEKFDTSAVRSIYGSTKIFSEDLIKEYSYLYNLEYVINRCGIVAGPWQFGKRNRAFFILDEKTYPG